MRSLRPGIHFCAFQKSHAQKALQELVTRYGQTSWEEAEVVVVLGGDGFMLKILHRVLHATQKTDVQVFGLNFGTVGFLMNTYHKERDLIQRVKQAQQVIVHPLFMRATCLDQQVKEAFAINEISLCRQTRQTARIGITVNGVVRMKELIGDGVLVATPAGSSAYNFSVYGPIIPLGSNVLAITPIGAFRPRRWRGALVPHSVRIRLDVHESTTRCVSATADFTEVHNVLSTEILETQSFSLKLLFDPENTLEERILKEQFQV